MSTIGLVISGARVGEYETFSDGDHYQRPVDDRERAIWYRGYLAGRKDGVACSRTMIDDMRIPMPSAGLGDEEE
jgi:hypothetical protein